MRYNYMMRQYIERISNTPEKQERLIKNAVEATKSATTEWSKDFWFGIFTKLCTKFNRSDLYQKNIH